jgi:hypothetical protein
VEVLLLIRFTEDNGEKNTKEYNKWLCYISPDHSFYAALPKKKRQNPETYT